MKIEVNGPDVVIEERNNVCGLAYPTHEQAFAAADALAKSLAHKDADRDATEVK